MLLGSQMIPSSLMPYKRCTSLKSPVSGISQCPQIVGEKTTIRSMIKKYTNAEWK